MANNALFAQDYTTLKILNLEAGLLSSILNLEIPFFYVGIFLQIIEYYKYEYTNNIALQYAVLFTCIEAFVFISVINLANIISRLPKKLLKLLNFIIIFAFLYFALISFTIFIK